MALRTRLRRAFTRGSQDEDGSLRKTSSKSSKSSKPKPDPNVYQPGEKMPPMKYRRPVAPEHKERLEAFNWTKAWRRKSDQSIYSPMGSRMPSRKNSVTTVGRRSIGGRKGSSRGHDGIGVDSGFGGSISGEERRDELVREASDDEGDVTNVGLSRAPTNDPQRHRKSSSIHASTRRSHSFKSNSSRPATATAQHRRSTSITKIATRQSEHSQQQGFTQEELELALKKSHLDPPTEESDRSGDASPHGDGLAPAPRQREVMLQA